MSASLVLAFDYGERNTGIAAGDSLIGVSNAVTTLHMPGARPHWQRIDSLIREWCPGTLVVGLPLNEDGSESSMSTRARRFGLSLQGRYQLPLAMVDERLSSVAAEQVLRDDALRHNRSKKNMRDARHAVAAQMILMTFFDQQRHAPHHYATNAPLESTPNAMSKPNQLST